MKCHFPTVILFFSACLLKSASGNKTKVITSHRAAKFRKERGLIFENGGVNKMIYGAIYPLYLEDPIKWRQLNCGYNIQAQYSVPTTPLYWWDRWEGRSLKAAREKFDKEGTFPPDESRKFVYTILETLMDNQGKNGRKCLLRGICENASIAEHVGIFAEILEAILTPGHENHSDDYHNAFLAGKSGADCFSMYPECPRGDSILDKITVTL